MIIFFAIACVIALFFGIACSTDVDALKVQAPRTPDQAWIDLWDDLTPPPRSFTDRAWFDRYYQAIKDRRVVELRTLVNGATHATIYDWSYAKKIGSTFVSNKRTYEKLRDEFPACWIVDKRSDAKEHATARHAVEIDKVKSMIALRQ